MNEKQVTEKGAVSLDEEALDQAAGGGGIDGINYKPSPVDVKLAPIANKFHTPTDAITQKVRTGP